MRTYGIDEGSFPSFLLASFVEERYGALIPDREQGRRTHGWGIGIRIVGRCDFCGER
jgi:hypothetical protein